MDQIKMIIINMEVCRIRGIVQRLCSLGNIAVSFSQRKFTHVIELNQSLRQFFLATDDVQPLFKFYVTRWITSCKPRSMKNSHTIGHTTTCIHIFKILPEPAIIFSPKFVLQVTRKNCLFLFWDDTYRQNSLSLNCLSLR